MRVPGSPLPSLRWGGEASASHTKAERAGEEVAVTAEQMAKQIQAFRDREAIEAMHREYIFCLRNYRYEEMIDCFAEDAKLAIRDFGLRTGKAEIGELFRGYIAKVKIPRGHALVHPVITVDGDRAWGSWAMYHFNYDFKAPAGTGRLMEVEQGRYDGEYVKVNGSWKFSYLKFTCPWPEPGK